MRPVTSWPRRRTLREIGRASCRGKGEISGGAGSFKKKKKKMGERQVSQKIKDKVEVKMIVSFECERSVLVEDNIDYHMKVVRWVSIVSNSAADDKICADLTSSLL